MLTRIRLYTGLASCLFLAWAMSAVPSANAAESDLTLGGVTIYNFIQSF
jgi:hypothetical protein